jgi:putative peptidoglycan lipid II flippase
LGLFGVSIAVAAFPLLSETARDPQRFVAVLSHSIRQILVFILPSAVLLIVLRAQIVRAVLGAGEFSWQDTQLTLQALSIFAVGLVGQALVLLLARAFYAMQNTKIPLLVGVIAEAIAIGSAVFFTYVLGWGVNGLAWGAVIGQLIQCTGLWLALWWRLGNVDGRRIAQAASKLGIATAFLVLVSWATKFAVAPFVNTSTFWGIVIQGALATLTGVGAYVGVGLLLRSDEMVEAARFLQRKILRRPQTNPIIELPQVE